MFFASLVFYYFVTAAALPSQSHDQIIRLARENVRTSKSVNTRNFKTLLQLLPAAFFEDLSKLNCRNSLLNVGAGRSAFEAQYLALPADANWHIEDHFSPIARD